MHAHHGSCNSSPSKMRYIRIDVLLLRRTKITHGFTLRERERERERERDHRELHKILSNTYVVANNKMCTKNITTT